MDKYVSIRLSNEAARRLARDLTAKSKRTHGDLTPYHETLDVVINRDDEGSSFLTVEDDGVLIMEEGQLVDYSTDAECVMGHTPNRVPSFEELVEQLKKE